MKRAIPAAAFILLLFFISGALALTYQVVWSRMMMHIFGSTAMAVGTVLAAFMTGLAIGSWKIGPLADRSSNCLRLYAILEIGIALAAIVSHALLSEVIPAHSIIFRLLGASAATFDFIRFSLAFVLVLVPTLLMGATLPVLARLNSLRTASVGVNLSTLYAVNTLGAVAGVLLTGFFLIGRYGIHLPVYAAAFGNVLIGALAWWASTLPVFRTPPRPSPERVVGGPADAPNPAMVRVIVLGLGLSGFTSFAYEIYWTRSLVFILGNSTYALTAMLSAFLTGIALGGYLVRHLLVRIRDGCSLFGWVQVALGVFSALALPLLFAISDPGDLSQTLLETSGQALPLVLTGFGVAFLVMLVPAMLIGATFPLAGQIGVTDPRRTGASVGRIYAINTLGNVLGALLPGMFLLSWLGIQRGILAMAVLNTLLGFAILFIRLMPSQRHPAWRVALPVLVVLTVIVLGRTPLQFQFPSEGESRHHETLFYREGPTATTKVFRDPLSGAKHMSVDGIVIGGTGMVEFKQLLLAHLPKLLLEDVSTELSIGVGSAILMGESFRHPGVRKMTAVEIEPGVVEGAAWFTDESHGVLGNQDLEVVVDDIGNFLRTTDGAYQVITADEKTADEYASNGFSYSLEYYALLRQHLAPGGLVAQWIPTTLPEAQYRMILRTFVESFPHAQLWYFLPAHKRGPFNSILIGSGHRIEISYRHIARQFSEHSEAFQALAKYGLTSAEAVLPHFIADEEVIRAAVSGARLNSLDHPRYEFYYPWDYTAAQQDNFVAIHRLITDLRRQAFPDYLAGLEQEIPGDSRLVDTFTAEKLFLAGFEKYLTGMTATSVFEVFDYVLAIAPWNDSLRARIYALYAYTASVRRNPAERDWMMRRADALYDARSRPGGE